MNISNPYNNVGNVLPPQPFGSVELVNGISDSFMELAKVKFK
jgi:hypothetical protein